MKCISIALLAMTSMLLVPGLLQAQSSRFDPEKAANYVHQVCTAARTGMELDECQYSAERLIANLRDCIRQRSALVNTCQTLLPWAEKRLAQVNNDPTLLEHRQDQRDAQSDANVRSLCALQNGGYYTGGYYFCMRNTGVDP